MTGWLLRRIGQALLVVAAMTVIVFAGLHAVGNPADILLGEDMNQQERLAAIARLGLDQPLWRQYLGFVQGVLRGDKLYNALQGPAFGMTEHAVEPVDTCTTGADTTIDLP